MVRNAKLISVPLWQLLRKIEKLPGLNQCFIDKRFPLFAKESTSFTRLFKPESRLNGRNKFSFVVPKAFDFLLLGRNHIFGIT